MPILRLPGQFQRTMGLSDRTVPQNQVIKIPDGEKGNLLTVEFMKKVARERAKHPLVRQLACNIVKQYKVPSMYYAQEALAIGDWVKKNFRYVRDTNGVETLQDPLTMIDQIQRGNGQGDCDDHALLIATLLLSIGHSPRFKVVKYNKHAASFAHIYVVSYERDKRHPVKKIVLDAIMKTKPIGFEVPHQYGKEIEI